MLYSIAKHSMIHASYFVIKSPRVQHIKKYFDVAKFMDKKASYIVSYAANKNDMVRSSTGIAVSSGVPGIITHTFDTIHEASGSPIIQNGKVVAVHIGSLTEYGVTFNLAVKYTDIDKTHILGYKLKLDYEGFFQKLGRNIDPTNKDGVLREGLRNIDPTNPDNAQNLVWCGGTLKLTPIMYGLCDASITGMIAVCPTSGAVVTVPACGSAVAGALASCGTSAAVLKEGLKKCFGM